VALFLKAPRLRRRPIRSSLSTSLLVVSALVLVPPTLAQPASSGGKQRAKNGLIAFQRVFFDADGFTAEIAIFTAKPNGTRIRQVTDPPPGVETGRMHWSPDGRRLAYMRVVLDSWRPHIFVVRPNGTDRSDLTKGHCRPSSCGGEEDPAWSPDAERIAFIRLTPEGPSLFVMRSDGIRRRQVMTPPAGRYTDWGPAWSPSGQRLVFRRWSDVREAAALFTVRLDGGDLRRITPWKLDLLNRPDWSPDGRWILFEKEDPSGLTQLCLIHPDGTGFRQITHSRRFLWRWGSFSPDGTMITALREPGERGATQDDIYVMNVDGSRAKSVTGSLLDPEEPFPPLEGLPDWGPR
jgi:Tol biopolymer transport system component